MTKSIIIKYNKYYDEVEKLYASGKSITESCLQIGISPHKYYRLCKKINKQSIATLNNNNEIKQTGGGDLIPASTTTSVPASTTAPVTTITGNNKLLGYDIKNISTNNIIDVKNELRKFNEQINERKSK